MAINLMCLLGVHHWTEGKCAKCRKTRYPEWLRADFLEAVGRGDVEKVTALLKDKPDLVFVEGSGGTPLYVAVYHNNARIATLLLNANAPINARSWGRGTPLQLATESNNRGMVAFLLNRGASVDIHTAASSGDLETVTSLLKDNPRLAFCEGPKGSTPLGLAASKGHWKVVEVLLANNAEVDASDDNGSTPLHLAAEDGNVLIAGFLVSKGAQVNSRDRKGRTPLHIAAEREQRWSLEPRMVKFLLANKADKNAKDQQGNTPLQSALDEYTYKFQRHDKIVLECVGCRMTYTPGEDAICITSAEMAALIGPAALRMGINMMIGHIGFGAERHQVEQDRRTIIKLARKGWVCKECHADNYWQPPNFPSELALLLQ